MGKRHVFGVQRYVFGALYVFCVQRYISFCTLPIIFLRCRLFYRIFAITAPFFRYLALLLRGFRRRHTIQTPMRTARIVKHHRFRHLLLHLLLRGKLQLGKKLILYRIVDTFRHRIMLRIAVLGHANRYAFGTQCLHILVACILYTMVGMVRQTAVVKVRRQGGQCHFQRPQRVDGSNDSPTAYPTTILL